MLFVCSIHSQQILDPSRFLGSFLIDSRHISRSIKVILCALCQLDSISTASQFVKTLLHALFFTCFAYFYYLVIHSILFHYIHAFIWIPCAPLIILDHLYISQVNIFSFLYPLSIMTKRGRKCGFFLRFYMLKGEIHAFEGGDVFHLVRGNAYFFLLVHQSCNHVYIHYDYI